jgi:hypothetical protein
MFFFKSFFKHKNADIDFEDILEEKICGDGIKTDIPEERMPVLIKKSLIILPFTVIAIFFCIAFVRIVYLQSKGSAYYKALAEKNRSQVEWLLPHRGIGYS